MTPRKKPFRSKHRQRGNIVIELGAPVPPPPPPPTDPDFADVSLLLPFDGNDAATATDDESNFSHPITFVGNAQLDTAQKKFGNSSLLLDGTGDRVTAPDDPSFSFGSAEWTVEQHVRFNGDPGAAFMLFVAQWGASSSLASWYFGLRNNQLVIFHSIGGGVIATLARNWNPAGDVWYHVAFCRDNSNVPNVTRVFVEGVQLGVDDPTINNNPIINNSASLVGVGGHGALPSDDLNGWLDNVRITLGVCRYIGNFTPPDAPYPTE